MRKNLTASIVCVTCLSASIALADDGEAEKRIDKRDYGGTEIPVGMRIVTVKVKQTKTHSGQLRSGDHVDVVLTYKSTLKGIRQPIQRTVTVLQNVKVFATGNIRIGGINNIEGDGINAKHVSLLVNPSDGNLLMLAENKGMLTLALRNGNDPKATTEKRALQEKRRVLILHGSKGGMPQSLKKHAASEKLDHLRAAIRHLRSAGQKELAHAVAQRAERLQAELHKAHIKGGGGKNLEGKGNIDANLRELSQAIMQLRKQMQGLQKSVEQLQKRRK